MFFGSKLIGGEWTTSVWRQSQYASWNVHIRSKTHPARVWVKELPEDSIFSYAAHAPAAVEKRAQHPLAVVDDGLIFLCLCRLRGIVCHRMFLGYWRDDQGRMEIDKRLAQRVEVGVAAAHFEVL